MSVRETPTILLVCTANRCRSPIAAALIERELGMRGLDARVESSGLMRAGEPVPSRGVAIAREYGLELENHRSTRLDPSTIGSADLVLAMARTHAREVVARSPDIWPRTFTLLQFDRWLRGAVVPRHAQIGPWLDSSAGHRARSTIVGDDPDDDVPDPIGGPSSEWRAVVEVIRAAVTPIVKSLAPLLTSH